MCRFGEAKILGADGIVDKTQHCIAGGHVKIVWLIVSFAHPLGQLGSFPMCLLISLSFIAIAPNIICHRKWLSLLQVITFHSFKGLMDSSWLRKSDLLLLFFDLASMYTDLTSICLISISSNSIHHEWGFYWGVDFAPLECCVGLESPWF